MRLTASRSIVARVDERYVPVLCFVGVALVHDHPIERVERELAGVALHHAAWDVPVRIAKREGNRGERFLHGLPAAILAVEVLPVERLCLDVLAGEYVVMPC